MTTESAMSSLKETTTLLYQVVSPILMVLGTSGNVLTIVVLSKRKPFNASTMVFLLSLAVSDLLVLNNGLLRYWVKYTFDVEVRNLSAGACCFQRFAIFLTTQFSSWMLVCVTIERFINTWLPHKRSKLCSTKLAVIVVGCIGLVLTGLNSHYLFGFGDKHVEDGNITAVERCIPLTERYKHFVDHGWTLIDMCVFYVIPVIVLVVCNVAIVYKVIKSGTRSRRAIAPLGTHAHASRGHDARHVNRTTSLTKSLVIVSMTYVFLVAPVVIFPIGQPYWEQGASQTKTDMLTLVETIAVLVMYVNHAINFLLYFLSGSKFRREVQILLCKRYVRMRDRHDLRVSTIASVSQQPTHLP